jgi:hypothetical protein
MGSLTLNPESRVASYAVKIVDGKIMVDAGKKAP